MSPLVNRQRHRRLDAIMLEAGFIRASDAAALVGVGLPTIHRWVKNGSVKPQRHGRLRSLYVSLDSLEDMHAESEAVLTRIREYRQEMGAPAYKVDAC